MAQIDEQKTPAEQAAEKETYRTTISNAQRHDHINDVDETGERRKIRYGALEKTEGKERSKSMVDRSVKLDGSLVGIGKAYAERTWGSGGQGGSRPGLVKTAAGIAGRKIEAAIGRGGNSDEIGNRAAGLASKYGFKAGKYAIKGGLSLTTETFRMARYGAALFSDVAAGGISGREAAGALLSKTGINIGNSGKAIGKIAGREIAGAIVDFRGSDDLGLRAVVGTKDLIVRTDRTIRMVQGAGRTLVGGIKTVQKAAEATAQAGRLMFYLSKKALQNLFLIKGLSLGLLFVVIIAGMVSIVSTVAGVIPAISLKSEDWELTQAYLYITELDANMQYSIMTEHSKLHLPPINEYHYYRNGVETAADQMTVYTDADLMLAYLDSKYEDYKFDGILESLFGTTLKDKISDLHGALHQVEMKQWSYIQTFTTTVNGVSTVMSFTINCLDINLTTISFEEYLEENLDALLTENQQEALAALLEAGIYTMRQELPSPFPGVDWTPNITSRWGWRVHPITGELDKHTGMDIAMSGGTPIHSCMIGVAFVGSDSGYGNFVRVEQPGGNSTTYAHMQEVLVEDEQLVTAGTVLGTVGSTGQSTGNHLHLEYFKDGRNVCPLIFTTSERN